MTQRSRHSLLPDSSDCQSDKEEDGKRHLLVLEERWICLGGVAAKLLLTRQGRQLAVKVGQ